MENILKNRLKQRHTLLKELCDKASNVQNRSKTEKVTLLELTEIGIKLVAATNSFEKEYLKFSECSTDVDQTEIDTYIHDQMKAEQLATEIETLKQIRKQTTEDMPQGAVSTKLPKFEIPKFSGDVLKWPEFWDKFDSNIHSRSINNVDKLSYLFAAMEGKALDALRGIDITNNNYDVAIEALKRRFGDKSLVIDAHYTALNNLPHATNQSARSTLDAIVKHLRILESLGEDTKVNCLRSMVCSKFPEKILYELNLITPLDRDLYTTIQGLEKIIIAKERSNSKYTTGTDEPTRHTTEALHVKVEQRQRAPKRRANQDRDTRYGKRQKVAKELPNCAFCRGHHYSDQCKKYETCYDRRKQLTNKCYKCFKHGHTYNQCKDKTTCHHCNGKHHRALCFKTTKGVFKNEKRLNYKRDNANTTNKDKGNSSILNVSDNESSNCLYSNINSYLQTATTKIKSSAREVPARLLLDCGSQRSYITSKLAKHLHISPDAEDKLVIYTFGSDKPTETTSPSAEVTLITKRGTEKPIRVNIVPHITDSIKVSQLPSNNDIVDIPADDDELGNNIDLLIGNDYYFSFLKNNYVKLDENLYLLDTEFGWMISGRPTEHNYDDLSIVTYCQCHGAGCPYFTEPDPPLRNIDLKFLWTLESIGIVDSPKATREDEAIQHFNSTVKYENGRYQVKWPWIEFPPELPTNFGLAFGRLKSLLKRANKATISDYKEILQEQLDSGIIEEVEPCTNVSGPVHYLPHHMIKQDGKRGRIVYDASAKIKEQKSLNECMYRGPSMLEDLTALLLKFRTGQIGISADVEKAFLQVGLQEEDRDVTRFLWVKDVDKDLNENNLRYYRFCRVPFGIISSPFLLTATIRYHLTRTNQALLTKIADRTYVDNLVTGAESLTDAFKLYEETRKTFDALSMNIRDWISNDKEFLKAIPTEHRAKQTETVKILGLNWNIKEDTLKLKLPQYEKKPSVTKKEVLKTLARLYDPCGFASPYILPAKLMFQQTCSMKLKWDSPLPPDLQEKWPKVLENIEAATDIEIPRYIGYNMLEQDVIRQLHCFTDASKNAYAAIVYLILKGKNKASTAFLMSKSRITPIEDKEDLKIPRLELLGYLIGSRLLKYVAENLDLEIHDKYLWTDSMIVLSWMNTSKLLPPFVSRRVNEIRQHKDVNLRYVPSEKNPADIATRPDIIRSQKELWFSGPEFLTKDTKEWPIQPCDEYSTLFSAAEAMMISEDPQMAGKGYEEVRDIEDTQVSELEIQSPEQEIQLPIQDSIDLNVTVTQIKNLQAKHFPAEVAGKQTSLSRNLDLFVDVDGILRCGGRMKNTDWAYETKHPILIPKLCEFTNQIIQSTHETNYHVGISHTLSLIRKNYWIPQGRAQVTKILKMCPQCTRHGGGPYKLPTAPALPSERVNFSIPFTFTGMDYFGPIYVETSKMKEKRWICLFTCLAVRAIHLELVNDLTAEECLLAVRRFVACRGKPSLIVSDNATQFKLTSEIFMDPHCVKSNIKWKFIPQLAPWHGGVYERLIAVVKNCLKRTLDKHLLKDSQLMTVVKEVETVVNSRPLTTVSSAEVEHILRPADFLTLGSCLELIPSKETPLEGTSTKIDLLKSWKRGQKIIQEFKMMFRDRYLPGLRERYFQRPKQPRVTSDRSPHVGDVVQIKDDAKNRLNWRVGKISALLEGQDGKCRVAKVQVGDQVFTRSIAHLYPLEAEMDSSQKVPNVEENKSPELDECQNVIEETIEVPSPQAPGESAVSENRHDENDVIGTDANDLSGIPVLGELELATEEMSNEKLPTDEVVSESSSGRVQREAAIRAREKIAEWTRQMQLLILS